jgi:DNA-directed RNA polymerase subunit omega
MARITVEDCLEKVENQYDLVLLAKERTSQLNSGSEMLVEEDNDKRTVIALREIAEGKVDIDELKKSTVLRLRKEPDENLEEQDTEEISSDDFEKQYKGEVSKSGVAILPSKRMRKIPTPSASSSSLEEDEKKVPEEESSPLKLTEEVEEKK